MKLWDKIFGKRYLDWDEYKEKINKIEEKNWQEAKTPRFRFRVSK
jgi:hypothetical protein